MDERNLCFASVILAQFVVFLFVALQYCPRNLGRNLATGLLAGVPLGAFFDLSIGRYAAIFNYFGRESSHLFMMINGILSYGLAIATVLAFNRMPLASCETARGALIPGAMAAVLILWLTPLLPISPLAAMFVLGSGIVVACETCACAYGRQGFVTAYLRNRDMAMWRIAIFAALIGLAYEAANLVFPVWQWGNRYPGEWSNLGLIICMGYFVLLLPVFTISSILQSAAE